MGPSIFAAHWAYK
jgi:hypothetical protein